VSCLNKIYENSINERLRIKELKNVDFDLGDYWSKDEEHKLRNYQKVGANFLYRSRACLLGDPVGVGKTPMAIAAMVMALINEKADFFLIVVPANLCKKWAKEIRKFTSFEAVELRSCKKRIKEYEKIFNSNKRNKLIMINSYSSTTRDTYETKKIKIGNRIVKKHLVRKDGLLSIIKKSGIKLGVIFDEVQKCKNYASLRTQTAIKLSESAKHTYGLSATYVEGRLEELYNVFKSIQPSVLGTFKTYQKNHIITNYLGEVVGYKNLTDARGKIAPYVERRFIEDIDVEMPDEIYQEYWINLTNRQKELYRNLVDTHLDTLRAKGNVRGLLEMLNERKCCLSTELINPESEEAPKIDALIDIIDSLEQEAKIVVFSFFGQTIPIVDIIARKLRTHFENGGNPSEVLTLRGGMSDNAAEAIRDRFSDDPNAKVLVTTDVSKEGHDILSARHVVHFDLLWNPAAVRQRAGRLIRFNQEAKSVVIHTLITKNTVEEYMWETVAKKSKVMKEIMDGGRDEYRITKNEAIHILENFRG